MRTTTHWLRHAATICGMLVLTFALIGATLAFEPHPASPATTAPSANHPRLIVDFGDGFQRRYTNLQAGSNCTVLSLLEQASHHAHGFKLETTGSGPTAFVKSIDGQANESGRGGKCWQYWINDRFGLAGVGVATLKPGDRVTWVFEPYSDDPKPPRD